MLGIDEYRNPGVQQQVLTGDVCRVQHHTDFDAPIVSFVDRTGNFFCRENVGLYVGQLLRRADGGGNCVKEMASRFA